MHSFLLVNVVGGVFVIGSYLVCLMLYPEFRNDLWGGIDGSSRKLFTLSMLPAALGYIFFLYFMVCKSGIESFQQYGFWLKYAPTIICAIFLVSATIWMPATVAYLSTSHPLWWVVTVGVLWSAALSLILLIPVTYWGTINESSFHKYLGIIGLAYITFHCTILDAYIWVVKFPR